MTLRGWALGLLGLCACAGPVEPVAGEFAPLGIGTARTVHLTAPESGPTTRRIVAAQLATLPPALRATPVVPVPLRTVDDRPGLLDHILDAAAELDEALLAPEVRNLLGVLCAPVASLNWRDTRLGGVLAMADATGAPLGELVAEALGRPPQAPLIPRVALVAALAEGLFGSHPEGDAHALWLRVDDLLDHLRPLTERYGPQSDHPGLFARAEARLATDALALRLALLDTPAPAPGVDLETGSAASVIRRPASPEALFDFEHPEWLTFEGLDGGDTLTLSVLSLRFAESSQPLPGGTARGARGDAAAWQAAPWSVERVLAEAAWRAWRDHRGHSAWPTADARLGVSVEAGWLEVQAWDDLPDGPAPGFVWDLVLDLQAARLRDEGVAEGAGSVDLALTEVPLGLTRSELVGAARAGFRQQADALLDIVLTTVGRGHGMPDVYYRADPVWGDQLRFITEADVPRDAHNDPVRAYTYPSQGFYRDLGLTEPVDGGPEPSMVFAAEPGAQAYVGDEGGRVFLLEVLAKPGPRSVALRVERQR
jgi:hypothetical protein